VPPAKQSDQQGTASSAPGTLFFPLYFFWLSAFSSCMQNERSACRRTGENNSPLVGCPMLGQAGSGPALMGSFHWARLVLAQFWCVCGLDWLWPSPVVWARSGPDKNKRFFCWAEIGPTLLGLSSAQLVGPAQPNPPNIIYYILYFFCIIYIYRYIKKN
jgi:hypothetical protein